MCNSYFVSKQGKNTWNLHFTWLGFKYSILGPIWVKMVPNFINCTNYLIFLPSKVSKSNWIFFPHNCKKWILDSIGSKAAHIVKSIILCDPCYVYPPFWEILTMENDYTSFYGRFTNFSISWFPKNLPTKKKHVHNLRTWTSFSLTFSTRLTMI